MQIYLFHCQMQSREFSKIKMRPNMNSSTTTTTHHTEKDWKKLLKKRYVRLKGHKWHEWERRRAWQKTRRNLIWILSFFFVECALPFVWCLLSSTLLRRRSSHKNSLTFFGNTIERERMNDEWENKKHHRIEEEWHHLKKNIICLQN